jgi:D-3-phosphoglycerate dehydrogenase
MSDKVLFLDTVHEILAQRLSAAGYACHFDYKSDREEIKKILAEYTGLVLRSRIKIDADLLKHAPSLKWIARSGSGLENIDLSFADQHNIEIINSPEGNRDAVGEHAIGMLLMLLNNLKQADSEVRKGIWDRETNRGFELSGKTIGIIGYGVMGSGFAEKISGFGCRILAYDKYKIGFGNSMVEEVEMTTIFDQADIVSIHLPLTEETIFQVDQKFLQSFKKPIYLINTARGKHVKISDLVDAIDAGKVAGACLDVLEFEKSSLEGLENQTVPEELIKLRNSDKVILSPHIAGWTVESYFKLSNVLADKILSLFK